MLFPNMTPRPKEHRGEAAAHRESVRGMSVVADRRVELAIPTSAAWDADRVEASAGAGKPTTRWARST
ncbi:MAG: hypothetical protein ACLTMP_07625 [Eggerthella lenta]